MKNKKPKISDDAKLISICLGILTIAIMGLGTLFFIAIYGTMNDAPSYMIIILSISVGIYLIYKLKKKFKLIQDWLEGKEQ